MAHPSSFAGLSLECPLIMGIVNVTPDSFSDGGEVFDTNAAIIRGRALAEAGADILDIGGESTRPGSGAVDIDEELARVIPVVSALTGEGLVVSIDTRHAAVMEAALEAGAAIINDVTALTGDAGSPEVAATSSASVVLMHMRGEPRTMQDDPHYGDVVEEVYEYLAGRIKACEAAGIPRHRIAVDPGIGFGKNVEHNLALMGNLDRFSELECAILLGVSRKSFIARLSRDEPPKARLSGSLAAAMAGVERGANILRVHDVAETRQALAVWLAIEGADQGFVGI